MDVMIIIYGIFTIMAGTAFCTWLWMNRKSLHTLYQSLMLTTSMLDKIHSIVKDERRTRSITVEFTPKNDD
jgi:hypothetical protein